MRKTAAATVGMAAVVGAALPAAGAEAAPEVPGPDKRKFMEEATRLAIESVEKGWVHSCCGADVAIRQIRNGS